MTLINRAAEFIEIAPWLTNDQAERAAQRWAAFYHVNKVVTDTSTTRAFLDGIRDDLGNGNNFARV